MILTSDGGFALAGCSLEEFQPGASDCLLVKTNAEGDVIFNRIYGEEGFHDEASSIIQTSDGGFAMAGYSGYIGSDFLLIRIGADGNLMWSKKFDFASSDYSSDLVQTSDGGFAIFGSIYEGDDADCWLGKTDTEGNLLWNRTYGNGSYEQGMALVQTLDGGFVFVAARSKTPSEGETWLVKTTPNGDVMWEQTFKDFGISGNDRALIQTRDGGYALACGTSFSGVGDGDFCLVKTDRTGNVLWNKAFEKESQDWATSVIETSDGGFALVGYMHLYSGQAPGDAVYIVRTGANGNMLWDQIYRGNFGPDWEIVQTSDGAFVIASTSEEDNGDFWLLKTEVDESADSTEQTAIDLLELAPYIVVTAVIIVVVAVFVVLRRKQRVGSSS